MDDYQRLHRWIEERIDDGPVAIVCHKNGDMDTVGSAAALSRSLGSNSRACATHLSSVAKTTVGRMSVQVHKIDPDKPLWPRELLGVIVVDCASLSQVGVQLPSGVPICVIDHHDGGSDWSEADLIVRHSVRSTAQIIYEYLSKYRPDSIDKVTASLLLAGMVADTGRFRHADGSALRVAGELVENHGIDYEPFIEEMESDDLSTSQRMAISKALTRVESIEAGSFFLLHTRGSSHEGIVANALINARAEVALVVRRAKDETRLIARASKSAISRGIHLGELMSELTERLEGEGGGHPGAAGWSGSAPAITAQSAFIAALSAWRCSDE